MTGSPRKTEVGMSHLTGQKGGKGYPGGDGSGLETRRRVLSAAPQQSGDEEAVRFEVYFKGRIKRSEDFTP